MSEKLEIYNLEGDLLSIEDRKDFYTKIKEEFSNTGKISEKVKTVRILLLNSSGRIYLQKRSKIKNENPGMYDKTVGGHVVAGDSFHLTAVKECAEELGFPMTIVDQNEFSKAIKGADLNIIGVFKEIDHIENFESTRIKKDGTHFVQPHITTMYLGYYNGPIKFVDGEASGVEVFSLDDLKEEIKINPDKFTQDLKFMIKKYEKFLTR